MTELVFLIEDAPEGGYVARALGASIVTEADDLPALREAIRDAVHCHFDGPAAPSAIRLHFVRDEVIAARSCRATWRVASSPGHLRKRLAIKSLGRLAVIFV